MDTGTHFLHNHPITERKLGLDTGHVIVDRDAWEYARGQMVIQTQTILDKNEYKRVSDLMTQNHTT